MAGRRLAGCGRIAALPSTPLAGAFHAIGTRLTRLNNIGCRPCAGRCQVLRPRSRSRVPRHEPPSIVDSAGLEARGQRSDCVAGFRILNLPPGVGPPLVFHLPPSGIQSATWRANNSTVGAASWSRTAARWRAQPRLGQGRQRVLNSLLMRLAEFLAATSRGAAAIMIVYQLYGERSFPSLALQGHSRRVV